MVKENLIHIKFEYDEALTAKKEFLTSEAELLRIAGNIERYELYRDKELELKMILYKKIKELKSTISSVHRLLPTLKLPDILKKYEEEYKGQNKIQDHINNIPKTTPTNTGGDVESQLREIERRLDELQNRG